MKHSHKLVLNTGALYLKIIINAFVTLFATRIALTCLGVNEYGLYNLIAGVIVLLSFFNGALMISTQRFLSIAIGQKMSSKLAGIFNTSFAIHLLIAILIGFILIIVRPFLFDGFLNIPDDSVGTAITVYYIMIITAIVTIIGIPYSAAINAHEDMIFFSVSEIISTLMRLVAALTLMFLSDNLLASYTWLMLLAIFVGFSTKFFWCKLKYMETKLSISLMKDRSRYNEMIGFVGWNTLGSVAVLVRNQGVAVVLNIFFGTVVNAAYGIANQVNAIVLTFAATLTTVFTPMIIQSKGAGDHQRMIFTAILSSKISFLLSSIIALPVVLFIPFILSLWLTVVPEYSESFCILIVITFIIMQTYPGINRAIYANGIIKGYQIVISIILVLNIPVGVVLFKLGFPPYSIIATMVIMQSLVLFATLYYANKLIQLNLKKFIFKFMIPAYLLFCIIYFVGYIVNKIFMPTNTLCLVGLSMLYMIAYFSLYVIILIDDNEKNVFKNLIKSIIQKIKKK